MSLQEHNRSESRDTEHFIQGFNELSRETVKPLLFRELETELSSAGYDLADNNSAAEVLYDNRLFCRSENFRKAVNLITDGTPIEIENPNHHANMCTMSSARGFRTAMTEGFGGKEVGEAVKVVVTFDGAHIQNEGRLPKDNELWQMKPETAEVSVVGSGIVTSHDVVMISFRFPTHLFPEQMLTERELDMLEEERLPFIVRHYTQNKKVVH